MKPMILIAISFLMPVLLFAQKKDYRVVFDMTSNDSVNQKNVIRFVDEVISNNPDARVEVVFYAQSLGMVVKDRSRLPDEVQKYAGKKNVSFRVCAIAMGNQHIDKSQLLTGVQTVPDGIYELIKKQREGWGYIKVAH